MSDATTLPGLLDALAARRPDGVAFRQKHLGIWRGITWSRYLDRVREVALALDEMGVEAGDRVVVFADNGPRWLYADLGIQALGAASVGVYAALDPAEAASAIASSGARIVFCGDQEQVDKLLERGSDAPGVEQIDRLRRQGPAHSGVRRRAARGLRRLRRSRPPARRRPSGPVRRAPRRADGRRGSDGRLHLGHDRPRARIPARPSRRGRARAARRGKHRAHGAGRGLLAASASRTQRPASSTPTPRSSPGRRSASPNRSTRSRPTSSRHRPPSSSRRRACSSASGARSSSAWAMPAGSSGARTVGRWAGSRGRRTLASPDAAARASAPGSAAHLVAGAVKRQAGLGRVRYAGIGGSFVANDSLRWFWALGVPVREQYGQVETGGIVTTQRGESDLGTAGLADRPLDRAPPRRGGAPGAKPRPRSRGRSTGRA